MAEQCDCGRRIAPSRFDLSQVVEDRSRSGEPASSLTSSSPRIRSLAKPCTNQRKPNQYNNLEPQSSDAAGPFQDCEIFRVQKAAALALN
ncbi:hypothetical protein PLANPX_5678 [Lacipirellula parvula]|uniref:Uncharacterized protein n=1 Tax=Lacipirellula parvula TaxID=2650471 RepID=A0A5K7XMK3_9BACT|nr:hypothetical protein PLANPX_5678 [Lacipirellula parvula]